MEVMLEIYRTLKALGMEWRVRASDADKENEGEGKSKEREGGGQESEGRRRRREEDERQKKANELYFVETRCRMDDVMVRLLSASATFNLVTNADLPPLLQVRMDLQLYRIDEQNYLVDFRNLGYRPLRTSPVPGAGVHSSAFAPRSQEVSPSGSAITSPLLAPGGELPSLTGAASSSHAPQLSSSLPHNTADELRARKPELLGQRRASAHGIPVPGHHHTHSGSGANAAPKRRTAAEVSSPYLFLETAVRLIVELASPAAAAPPPSGTDAQPAAKS